MRAIFRMTPSDRAAAALHNRGGWVDLVHSPLRGPDCEKTYRGTVISVAGAPAGDLSVVLRREGITIDLVFPLSQVRSITEVPW